MAITYGLQTAARIGLGFIFTLSGILKIFSPDSAAALINQILTVGSKPSFVLIVILALVETGIGVMLLAARKGATFLILTTKGLQ